MRKLLTGLLIAGGTAVAGVAVMTALDRRARRTADEMLQRDIERFENESMAPPPAI